MQEFSPVLKKVFTRLTTLENHKSTPPKHSRALRRLVKFLELGDNSQSGFDSSVIRDCVDSPVKQAVDISSELKQLAK
jgi:hypothetical protein